MPFRRHGTYLDGAASSNREISKFAICSRRQVSRRGKRTGLPRVVGLFHERSLWWGRTVLGPPWGIFGASGVWPGKCHNGGGQVGGETGPGWAGACTLAKRVGWVGILPVCDHSGTIDTGVCTPWWRKARVTLIPKPASILLYYFY